MKRAFSYLELVIVLIVLAILFSFALPNLKPDTLALAANQVAHHIRYTQHLALLDDKMGLGEHWYRRYWRIYFHSGKVGDTKKQWRYTIFSDDASFSGNPNSIYQIALNPENPTKRLTSGFAKQYYKDAQITPSLNLSRTYGVSNIVFKNCGNNNQTIAFDSFGAPSSTIKNANSPFEKRLLNDCEITLFNAQNRSIKIIVYAITGYVKIVY